MGSKAREFCIRTKLKLPVSMPHPTEPWSSLMHEWRPSLLQVSGRDMLPNDDFVQSLI